MVFNLSSIKNSSNGVWQGDSPLDYAFPLLILQIFLILLLSHSLALLFKPLRQPKAIAEIVGGILLGPSAFGRNQNYMHRVFPSWSTPVLESVASIGLLFFLFLVGLELDLNSIRRSRGRAFAIAATGISVPFILGIGVTILLRKTIDGADKVGFVPFIVFIGVALSITAFPVLARILAELNLLTTEVGKLAMAAAALNDTVAWILLALAVAIAGDGGHHKSLLVLVWVLLSGVGFVIFMMFAIRPAMKWVARRSSSEQEACICLTLAGVMVSGFMTDLIGIHSIFGAFVFGLTIPRGDFAEGLIVRIEDFVSGLLLPLYFASSGLKTNVTKIQGGEAWGLLALVITAACAGKILGTSAAAMMCLVPARESLTLGFLMNTKGLVELIVLNIGKDKMVLNDEMFAILVLMALFTTFITTPSVMAIYEPARGISARTRRRLSDLFSSSKKKATGELRVLACVLGPGNVPSSIIRLIDLIRSTENSLLKHFIMHLVELTERSSSIVLTQRTRKNGFPFFDSFHGCLGGACQAYSQCVRVSVRRSTAISSLSTMHEDICHVAERKRVTLIILPFHKQWRMEMEEEEIGNRRHEIMDNVGHGWRGVNQRVLKNSPCSVAVLVDRGIENGSAGTTPNLVDHHRVCILFFGGPDDREAMELGSRMTEHTAVKVTVVRFVDGRNGLASDGGVLRPSPNKCCEKSYTFSTATMNREKEQGLDETAVEEFRRKWDKAVYQEKAASNIVEEVLRIGQSGEYDLIVVGKGRFPSSMVAEMAERQADHAELGPIGDILASSGQAVLSSVLVIQQHDVELEEEAPMSKGVGESCESSSIGKGNSTSNDNNKFSLISILANMPKTTSDTRAELWRARLGSALRTTLACTIVGCTALHGPAKLRQYLEFTAFSYVTTILIAPDANLGDTIRGCWHVFCATLQVMILSIVGLLVVGPEHFTSPQVAAAMVAASAFMVAVPEATDLLTKRIAFGQIVIVYVSTVLHGAEAGEVLKYPIHVACSTALGAFASVLAMLFPYPRLAHFQVKKAFGLYAENASERFNHNVEAISASDNSTGHDLCTQSKSLAKVEAKLLQLIKSNLDGMSWERHQMRDFYGKLQDKEIPLRGMDIALSSCTSFPVGSIDEELRGVLLDYRGRFSLKLNKQASCFDSFDATTAPESRNRENSNSFPLPLKHLPTSFFMYCVQLLQQDTPIATNTDNMEEKTQKTDAGILKRIKEVFMNRIPSRQNLTFALKCSVTMGFAVFFGLIYDKENAFWSGLAVATSFVTGRQPTFSVSNARGQGTAMGMIYGVICRSVLHRFGGLSFLPLLPWVFFSCFLMHSEMYGQSGGISAVLGGLLILGRNHYGPPEHFAIARMVEATIGLTCFVCVEIIISPSRAASLAKSELSHSFRALQDCIDTIAIASSDKQKTCCTNSQELRKRQKNLKTIVCQLHEFIEEAELEPNFWFLPFHGACYRKILDSLSTTTILLLFVAHSIEDISRLSLRGVTSVELQESVNEVIELFKAKVGPTLKCLEEITQIKSLRKLEHPNLDTIRLLRGHEEAQSIACSFLQKLEDKADAVHSNASSEEAVEGQIIAHYSCLRFCITGLTRETINIEKAVKELVGWEN